MKKHQILPLLFAASAIVCVSCGTSTSSPSASSALGSSSAAKSSTPSASSATPVSSSPAVSSPLTSSSVPVVTYTITFHFSSNAGDKAISAAYAVGEKAVAPSTDVTDYAVEGITHYVSGWYSEKEGGTLVSDFTVTAKNCDYYAHYAQKTLVVFPSNDAVYSLKDGNGDVLSGDKFYETGTSVSAVLTLTEAYSQATGLKVSYGASELGLVKNSDGSFAFTINTATSGTIAIVVSINKVGLTLATSDVVEAQALDGTPLASEFDYGSAVQFKVVGKTGHEKAYTSAALDGVELLPNADGVYTIESLKSPASLSIAGYEGAEVLTKASRAWLGEDGTIKGVTFDKGKVVSAGTVYLAADALDALRNQGYPFLDLTMDQANPLAGYRTVVMDGESYKNWYYASDGEHWPDSKFPGEYYVNLNWSCLGAKGILFALQDTGKENSSESFAIQFKHVSSGDGWSETSKNSGNMFFDEGDGNYTFVTLNGAGGKSFASPAGWLSAISSAKDDLFLGTKYVAGGATGRSAIWGSDQKDLMNAIGLSEYWSSASPDGYYYLRFDYDANIAASPFYNATALHLSLDDADTVCKLRLGGIGAISAKETAVSGSGLNWGNDLLTGNPYLPEKASGGWAVTARKYEDPYFPTAWLKRAKADGIKSLSFSLALASTDTSITTDNLVWYTRFTGTTPAGGFHYGQVGLTDTITVDLETNFYPYLDNGVTLGFSFRSSALGDGVSYGAKATFTNITLA
jgi:hypothetical protein